VRNYIRALLTEAARSGEDERIRDQIARGIDYLFRG